MYINVMCFPETQHLFYIFSVFSGILLCTYPMQTFIYLHDVYCDHDNWPLHWAARSWAQIEGRSKYLAGKK